MVTQVRSRTDDKGRRRCCLFGLKVNLHNNISSEYSIIKHFAKTQPMEKYECIHSLAN